MNQLENNKAYSPDLNLIQILNKKWEECTDAERIMKLRDECRDLQYLIQRTSYLEERVRILENHTHADGKVVAPIINNQPNGLLGGGASRRNNLS